MKKLISASLGTVALRGFGLLVAQTTVHARYVEEEGHARYLADDPDYQALAEQHDSLMAACVQPYTVLGKDAFMASCLDMLVIDMRHISVPHLAGRRCRSNYASEGAFASAHSKGISRALVVSAYDCNPVVLADAPVYVEGRRQTTRLNWRKTEESKTLKTYADVSVVMFAPKFDDVGAPDDPTFVLFVGSEPPRLALTAGNTRWESYGAKPRTNTQASSSRKSAGRCPSRTEIDRIFNVLTASTNNKAAREYPRIQRPTGRD